MMSASARASYSLFSLCVALVDVNAQNYFQKAFGGLADQRGYSIAEASDGSIFQGGYTLSFLTTGNNADAYLVKCDRSGQHIWSRHFDVGLNGIIWDLAATTDEGVIVAGTDNNNNFGFAFKVDGLGNLVWGRASNAIKAYRAIAYRNLDSTVFLAGPTLGANQDIHLQKLNSDGTAAWSKGYGTGYNENVYSLSCTSDGGLVLSGSALDTEPESDGLLMKLDSAGVIEWSRTYGLSGICDVLYRVIESSTGGYVAVGGGCYSDTWPIVVRTDANGDTLWTKRFAAYAARLFDVEENQQGFLVTSNDGGVGGYYTISVVQLDQNGGILWRTAFTQGSESLEGRTEVLTDGSIAVGKSVIDVGPGPVNLLLAVVDSVGMGGLCGSHVAPWTELSPNLVLGAVGDSLPHVSGFSWVPTGLPCATLTDTLCSTSVGLVEMEEVTAHRAFPNPTSGSLLLTGLNPGDVLMVLDGLGKELIGMAVDAREHQVLLPSVIPSGLLLVLARSKDGDLRWSEKIILQR
ncbi:MAG: PQQ-like beta-propeller repeat protein [Flavobacteriales bacterium]|nr:MAG: PQQ-like beta-propeller repeat protein [Flavobacteriales bacterium]